MKRELKTRPIYDCRCDERLKTKAEESTRLGYTGLLEELEHLKIKTRFIDEMFASVMGEYVFLKWCRGGKAIFFFWQTGAMPGSASNWHVLANARPGLAFVASAGRLVAGSCAGALNIATGRGARGSLNCRDTFADSSELQSAASFEPLAGTGCSSGWKLIYRRTLSLKGVYYQILDLK